MLNTNKDIAQDAVKEDLMKHLEGRRRQEVEINMGINSIGSTS
jgi:hypothetical protein